MSSNNSRRTTLDRHTQQRVYPDSRVYLLGVDMAPLTRQSLIVAPVHQPLGGGQLHEEEEEFSSEDENVDPPSYIQPRRQIGMVPGTSSRRVGFPWYNLLSISWLCHGPITS